MFVSCSNSYRFYILGNMKAQNNRLHKGPQKAGDLGNKDLIIKRASSIVRIPFVACEAGRYTKE